MSEIGRSISEIAEECDSLRAFIKSVSKRFQADSYINERDEYTVQDLVDPLVELYNTYVELNANGVHQLRDSVMWDEYRDQVTEDHRIREYVAELSCYPRSRHEWNISSKLDPY